MERDIIIKKVLARLDEVSHAESIDLVPDPTISLLLDDGIDTFLLLVPNHLIKDHLYDFTGGNLVTYDHYTGYIALPENYLKLVKFRMHSWKRPVTEPIYSTSPEYRLQSNKYLRGTPDRPVAAILYAPAEFSQVVEYYSVSQNDHTCTEAQCVIKTTPDDLQDSLTDPFSWFVASTVASVQGAEKAAQYAMGKVQEFIQANSLINSGQQQKPQ